MTKPIYAAVAHYYLQRGFAPLPLPPRRKASPPGGFTGADGDWPSTAIIQSWMDFEPADSNIGLRLPRNVIGIDVDAYEPKHGAQTLADLEQRLGALPLTWRSTSRPGDPISGVRLYQLPKNADSSQFGDPGPDIETLRYEHRYMVAAPSIHPKTEQPYVWISPEGTPKPPSVSELPILPDAWVAHLVSIRTVSATVGPVVTVQDIPAERLPAVASWARAALAGIVADLQAAKQWPEGHRDDHGRGWEKLTADKFLRAHRILLAVRDVLPDLANEWMSQIAAAAPQSATWTKGDVGDKWKSQGRAAAKMGPVSLDGVGSAGSSQDIMFAGTQAHMAPGGAVESAPPAWRRHSWDDIGNAERVEAMYGATLRWLADAETWIAYDGRRWREGSDAGAEAVQSMVDQLPDLELDLYSGQPDPNDTSRNPKSPREKFSEFVHQQRFTGKAKSGAEMTRIRGRMTADSTDFDASPGLLGVGNGVVDLETGALMPHAAEHMLRTVGNIAYDPNAVCPRWEAFLERVHPDAEVRNYLQRVIGYSITGHTNEQVFFLHHGVTANGKSVFLRVIEAMLGDLSQVIPPKTLLVKREDQHPTDIDRMEGRRFLQLSETPQGARFDGALVKRLTGEETITARGMGKDFREFRITGKVHVVTNHPPHGGDDVAVARRMRVIRWGVTIPPEERDRRLAVDLIAHELPGILAWAVRGALQWREHGLAEPFAIETDTQEYLEGEDTFGQWIRERDLTSDDGAFTPTQMLYVSYDAWCRSGGVSPMNVLTFGKELASRGFTQARTKHGRGWRITPPQVQQV